MGDATLQLPDWPRALSEPQAAAYASLSVSAFRAAVLAGDAPSPFWLTRGRKAWHRGDLDAWIDRKAGRVATRPDGTAQDWMER